MRFAGPFNSGVAAGGDGVATANTDSPQALAGLVYGIYIEYQDSPPAGTTDVTISTKGIGIPEKSVEILKVSDASTDGWFFPRLLTVSAAAANNTADYDEYPVHDIVNVKIEGANANDNVDVWLALKD